MGLKNPIKINGLWVASPRNKYVVRHVVQQVAFVDLTRQLLFNRDVPACAVEQALGLQGYEMKVWLVLILISLFTPLYAGSAYSHELYHQLISRENMDSIQVLAFKNVDRNGDTLNIRTKVGIKSFKNCGEIGERSSTYYFVGRIINGRDVYFVISVYGWEGRWYDILNSQTGKVTDFYNVPLFSPDGNKVIDYSIDLDAGYSPNIITIYRIVNGGFEKDWEYHYKHDGLHGPDEPQWISNSKIIYFETKYEGKDRNLWRTPMIVDLQSGVWSTPREIK